MKNLIKIVDLALLLGAPLEDNPELLNKCADILSEKLHHANSLELSEISNESTSDTEIHKQKTNIYQTNTSKRNLEHFSIYEELIGVEVDSLSVPTLEAFYKDYFLTMKPLKITGKSISSKI